MVNIEIKLGQLEQELGARIKALENENKDIKNRLKQMSQKFKRFNTQEKRFVGWLELFVPLFNKDIFIIMEFLQTKIGDSPALQTIKYKIEEGDGQVRHSMKVIARGDEGVPAGAFKIPDFDEKLAALTSEQIEQAILQKFGDDKELTKYLMSRMKGE